ncbi:alanine dehydrogenase, partial [Staphylococcus aureus]
VNTKRLQQLDDLLGGRVHKIVTNPMNIELYVKQRVLAFGVVLIPGANAPILTAEVLIKQMKNGTVIIYIAID